MSKPRGVLPNRLKKPERSRLQSLVYERKTSRKNSNESVIRYLTREEIQYNRDQVKGRACKKLFFLVAAKNFEQ